jgi:RHS repeat-associated protein
MRVRSTTESRRSGRIALSRRAYLRAIELVQRWILVAGLLLGLSTEAEAASSGPPAASGPKPGSTGQVSEGGGYTTSIPLDLPEPRGQLTVPVSVTYAGGGRAAEAGVGWNIPIAYVRLRNNVSQHKPKFASMSSDIPSSPPTEVKERLSLDLGAGSMLMNPVPASTSSDMPGVYRPMFSAGMELRKTPRGWTALDGSGRAYFFEQLPALDDKTLWVLTEIQDRTQKNKVTLTYSVETPAFPNQSAGISELFLTDVRYAFSAQECAKYRIQLSYVAGKDALPGVGGVPQVLAYYGSNGAARLRTKVLDTITTWAAADAGCASVSRLNTTKFSYSAAPDTKVPMLAAVDQFGEGTPPTDLTKFKPVARFQYGTSNDGQTLTFGNIHTMDVQADAEQGNLFGALLSSTYYCGYTGDADDLSIYFCPWAGTTRALRDMTGDGRADLLYTKAIQYPDPMYYGHSYTFPPDQGMFLARTQVDQWGTRFAWSESFWDLTTSYGAFFVAGFFHNGGRWLDTTVFDEYYHDGEFQARGSHATRQLMDWNGDGRTDVVWSWGYSPTANEPYPSYWHVKLNTKGADEGSIAWKDIDVDYAPIVTEVKRFVTTATPLIFDQFKLDRRLNREECWEQMPNNVFHNTCAATPPAGLVRKHHEYNTITEWKLMDVNGDKLPDFLFSAPSNEKADNAMPGPGSSEVRVMYNRGGTRPFDGTSVRLHTTTCGVERLRGFDMSAVNPADPDKVPRVTYLSCGFLDVNGDGLIDYVDEDDRETRPPQFGKQFWSRVYLGTGIPGDFKLSRSFTLPAPVTVNQEFTRDGCPLPVDAQTTMDVSNQWSGLLDMTGDGVPDFVYHGLKQKMDGGIPVLGTFSEPPANGSRWWVMAGTTAGFADPVLLDLNYDYGEFGDAVPAFNFQLSESIRTCDAQGKHPTDPVEVSGLADMDGDGLPEGVCGAGRWVRCGKDYPAGSNPQKLLVANIVTQNMRQQLPFNGAPEASRLTEIDNGFGGVTRIFWGNAKTLDIYSQHNSPFPEIVVTSTEQLAMRGLGESTAPVLFAYTDPQIMYQPLLDTWTFTGYGRRLEMTGTLDRTFTKGTLTVTDALKKADIPGGDLLLEQVSLVGKTKEVNVFNGAFVSDPWQYVGIDTGGGDLRVKRGTMAKWNMLKFDGYSNDTSLDCQAYRGMPWNGPSSPEWAFELPIRDLCHAQVLPYLKEQASWEGDLKPQFGVAAGGHAIETYWSTDSIDLFGRPVTVTDKNDINLSEDDVCITYDYATSTRTDILVLDALAGMHVRDCKDKKSKPIAGVKFRYDALTGGDALPDGVADRGLLTAVVQEVYQGTALLSSKTTDLAVYDKYGNVTSIGTTVYNPDTIGPKIRVRSKVWDDAFALVVKDDSMWGPNLPTVAAHIERNPVTMFPTVVTTANGAVYRTEYDTAGRPFRTFATPDEGGLEYLMNEFTYVDDPADAQGARVEIAAFDNNTTLATSMTATRETIFYDEFGRTRFTQMTLGADYGNRKLYSNVTKRDALGRTTFEAVPFQTNNIGSLDALIPSLYGTTYFYGADGQVQCAIRGVGPQLNNPVTSPADDRYVDCYTTNYEDGRRIAGHLGPNENLPTDERYGIYDKSTYSATGQLMNLARAKGSEALEFETFLYDRLGNMTARTRFNKPATTEEPVSWTYTNDSFGRVLKAQEPGEAEKTFVYDTDGNLVRMQWMGPGNHIKGGAFTYDGFSRLATDLEFVDNVPVLSSKSTFHYDTPADSSEHVSPTNLLGHMSWAENNNMRTYFGYNRIGKVSSRTWVAADDSAPYTERWDYTSHGQLQQVNFELPDTEQQEGVQYHYDSAHRIFQVDWRTEAGEETLFEGQTIDDFGRYTKVQYGNGVQEAWTYRPDRRREMQDDYLVARNGTRDRYYEGFDGQGREKSHVDVRVTNGIYSGIRSRYGYDKLNRLSQSITAIAGIPGTVQTDESFTYSPLGSLLKVDDNLGNTGDLSFEADPLDKDRICKTWNHSTQTKPSVCNHTYDERGATLSTDTGASMRNFTYNAHGDVLSITKGSATASFAYDPFGQIAALNVVGAAIDNRQDRRYGSDIERSKYNNGQFVIERKIYGPMGLLARRRGTGPSAIMLYQHGDNQGGQYFTDNAGNIVQEEDYTAFGAIKSETATPGDLKYTKELWNSGDTLRAFGVTQLGPRLYDPRLRRFLQRDPLAVLRSASADNPYAFSLNDPVNAADPSGRDAVSDLSSSPSAPAYAHYDSGLYYGWNPNAPNVVPPPGYQYNGHYEVAGGKVVPTYRPIPLDGHKETRSDPGAIIPQLLKDDDALHDALGWTCEALGAAIDAGMDALKGIGNMIAHPQQTAEGLYNMAAHPIDSATSIAQSAWDFGKDLAHGNPKAFGKLFLGGVTTAMGVGLFSKAGALAGAEGMAEAGIAGDLAGAARVAEGAEDAATVMMKRGGRLGKPATRAHVGQVADELEARGWKIEAGGNRTPHLEEEYLPGPTRGTTKGSNYADITATKNGRTLRVNTVDTLADGVTPTVRELDAAKAIRAKRPGDKLLLVPKPPAP